MGELPGRSSNSKMDLSGGSKRVLGIVMVVARICVSSAFQICTMCRSQMVSTSLKTYVPGGRTCPGTSTESLKVTMVFLSHWSALATGASVAQHSIVHSANTTPLTVCMILPS